MLCDTYRLGTHPLGLASRGIRDQSCSSDLRTGLDAAGQPREGVAEPHRLGIEGGLPRLAVPCVDSRSFPEELPLSLGGTNGVQTPPGLTAGVSSFGLS